MKNSNILSNNSIENNEYYALVTGASQGIGKALALELASKGYNLIIISLPNSGLFEASAIIKESYRCIVLTYEIDLTIKEEVSVFLKWMVELNLPIKIWINNAGLGYEGDVYSLTPSFTEKLLDLNVKTLALFSHWFVNYLREKKEGGYLMNLGSMASFFSLPNKSFYSASKSFVLDFSQSLREEVKEDGVSVSCLCPGPVCTNQQVTRRIACMGLKAKYFVNTPEKLAQTAIREMMKGKAVIIPTIGNKFLWLISCLIPQFFVSLYTSKSLFSKKTNHILSNDKIN